MDADPDAHDDVVRPRLGVEGALHRDGRVDGGPGRLEDGEELVGARLDLVSAGIGDALPQHRQTSSISSR